MRVWRGKGVEGCMLEDVMWARMAHKDLIYLSAVRK